MDLTVSVPRREQGPATAIVRSPSTRENGLVQGRTVGRVAFHARR